MQNINHNHIEQKSTNILYPALNIAAVASLSLMFLVGISTIGGTVSYFSDVEKSIGNFFTADPLYFSVVLATSTIEMSAGDQLVVPEMVPGDTSEPAQYYVRASMLSGNAGLCDAIHVLATAPLPTDAQLAGLQTATTTDTGPWALTLYLAPGSAPAVGSSCTIDLIYTGWNAGAQWGNGYSDIQHVPLTFTYNPAPLPASAGGDTATPSTDIGAVEGTSTEATSTADIVSPPDATSTSDSASPTDPASDATSTNGDSDGTLSSPTSSDTALPANDTIMPPTTPDTGAPAQTPPVEVPPTTPAPQEPTAPTAQQ